VQSLLNCHKYDKQIFQSILSLLKTKRNFLQYIPHTACDQIIKFRTHPVITGSDTTDAE